ncbi:MAG: RNase adapter RapZ [Hydrogenophilus sp.]|nr:RNase adapter RapZ [Hydrogenophilus sp.]
MTPDASPSPPSSCYVAGKATSSSSSPPLRIVVISGVSGAGKTVALRALEDNGFIALDNLPVPFLVSVVTHIVERTLAPSDRREGVAVAVDIRSGDFAALPAALRDVECATHIAPELLFLDARDDILLTRFSETRRAHPLAGNHRTLLEAIAHERELLAPIAEAAHRLDTSNLTPQQLRRYLTDWLQTAAPHPSALTLTLQSFAFKRGVPLDADLLFDARCLPNPYYHPDLRPLTGRDPPVRDYLSAQPLVNDMENAIADFLTHWLPHYAAEARRYLTVAIGCTGGQHRSVYLVERLAERLAPYARILIRHRLLL